MKTVKILLLCVMVATLASCNSSKRIVYFQDAVNEAVVALTGDGHIRIKPFDRLTVVVTSKDSELAAPFNAATSYNSLSSNPVGMSSSNGVQSLQVRTVDENGILQMPIIGDIQCAGKTRQEIADDITKKIVDGGYISDAMVNIQFVDMRVFVLGEVTRPGQYEVVRDRVTLLEALSMAGDLTIYGNRTNVSVIRKVDGSDKNQIYQVDLLSSDAMSSPAYYLQQGDVVYVQPNRYKAATAEINQNRTFWISIASTLVSVATLVATIVLRNK